MEILTHDDLIPLAEPDHAVIVLDAGSIELLESHPEPAPEIPIELGPELELLHPPEPLLVLEHDLLHEPVPTPPARPRGLKTWPGRIWRSIASATEWMFGLVSLVLGLSILAAIPIVQFLSLGYLLESSSRVALSGRLRDGFIGVRRSARIGGVVLGSWLALLPLQLVRSFADTAAIIDPGGPGARLWRLALVGVAVLTFLHVAMACLRGGKIRYFLWPFSQPFWLRRTIRNGGFVSFYRTSRDQFWSFVQELHIPQYFRQGAVCFLGTLIWLAPPVFLISVGGRFPLLWFIGAFWLAVVVPFLPFLQIHYALEGRFKAMFDRKAARERYKHAPWAFAFALFVLILASIPLHLLKIEMIPREAAWLPCLAFVIFLAPARILTGWAYARSLRRHRPRHWFFRTLGRFAIVPTAAFYVLVVFLAQYTSWNGTLSLYEQHAFLLPVPFLNL